MSWKSVGDGLERGPVCAVAVIFTLLLVIGIPLSIVGYFLGWFAEAAQVAKEQFGPSELLRKYEWFKDAAASLDKKKADISVYESRVKAMEEGYKGTDRVKWPREDREQINVWRSEVAGVKAAYNTLAAEYNSAMSKFNWSFCSAGSLPKGADVPLPREFKPYVSE